MKIRVTRGDVNQARKMLVPRGGRISRCCPVFQALRRKGFRPAWVAYSEWSDRKDDLDSGDYSSGLPLGKDGMAITNLMASDWDKAVGMTFTAEKRQ